jgi:DNA-binding transcriptional LysR family regulator
LSSHFDLVDFRLFANIAEANSFTAGAERSNLSTSAASLRIRHLEESLGGQLFNRTSHGSTLTPAGEACLVRIRAILQEFEALKADLRRYSEDDAERLTIAASNAGVNEPLPSVMRAFTRSNPAVRIALHVRFSNEILGAVADGLADIGIGASGRSTGTETLPYLADRLVLVMAPGHPLAVAKALRFADALDYEIIGLPEEAQTQKFMRSIAQNSRKPMRNSVIVSSQEGLFQMVEAGLGIGVISERAAQARAASGSIALVALKDKSAASDVSISVASLRSLSDHARRFVEMLQSAADQGMTSPPSTGRIAPVT